MFESSTDAVTIWPVLLWALMSIHSVLEKFIRMFLVSSNGTSKMSDGMIEEHYFSSIFATEEF